MTCDLDWVSISTLVRMDAIIADAADNLQDALAYTKELFRIQTFLHSEVYECNTLQFDARKQRTQNKEGTILHSSANQFKLPVPQTFAQLLSHCRNIFVWCCS